MKVLVVGGGGREHALAWKTAQSELVDKVYVAPGNAGTSVEPLLENININVTDLTGLLRFAQHNQIELTIVGPEVPLVLGIVDKFNDAGLACFGPSKGAAQLEGSKTFMKDFLARHNIPTAAYESFTNKQKAIDYVKKMGAPIVIKADGLAAGKGVILAQTEAGAISAIEDMLAGNAFGKAGHRVVIEEYLLGEEASFIVMVDGEHILPLATSQDHKARDNGDKGPNTGGMGAYSPASVVTPEIHQQIMQDVIEPTVKGMADEGNSYTGFLYAGIMIAPDGSPKVLEYNCRFGDPETQPIMMRLKSDLVELCLAGTNKTLNKMSPEWDSRYAVGVVLASGGYPDEYPKGLEISGLPITPTKHSINNHDEKVFHAGTLLNNGKFVTNGGRVLCAVALGDSVSHAQKNAYALTSKIHWENVYYRTDIAHREIKR